MHALNVPYIISYTTLRHIEYVSALKKHTQKNQQQNEQQTNKKLIFTCAETWLTLNLESDSKDCHGSILLVEEIFCSDNEGTVV